MELAILRNKLLAKRFGENENLVLREAKVQAHNWESAFSNLILFCLDNIEKDVSVGEFENAAVEAQLIHNLPEKTEDVPVWDEQYFYLFELRSYLNKVKDFTRIKRVVSLVGDFEQLKQ